MYPHVRLLLDGWSVGLLVYPVIKALVYLHDWLHALLAFAVVGALSVGADRGGEVARRVGALVDILACRQVREFLRQQQLSSCEQ